MYQYIQNNGEHSPASPGLHPWYVLDCSWRERNNDWTDVRSIRTSLSLKDWFHPSIHRSILLLCERTSYLSCHPIDPSCHRPLQLGAVDGHRLPHRATTLLIAIPAEPTGLQNHEAANEMIIHQPHDDQPYDSGHPPYNSGVQCRGHPSLNLDPTPTQCFKPA